MRSFDFFLLVFLFIFSLWLMHKSFGYDPKSHSFRIARHQVGDFGLHLSLIRSFSWGENFPPELPFFPGRPLPYHYYFDLFVGLLERNGVRIDIALNGLSAVAFTWLLFLIYKMPQLIFQKSRILGLTSVLLFIFHSSLTFIDFVKQRKLSMAMLNDLWLLPDYIHKGPFDNSIISIFFTLNVFLNQRHLIVALAINISILYYILQKLSQRSTISFSRLFMLGLVIGFTSRVHSLVSLGTVIVAFCLFVVFRRFSLLVPLAISVSLPFSILLRYVLNQSVGHPVVHLGFLASRPLTMQSFFTFWLLNLGVALVLMPLGVIFSNASQRKIFYGFLPLFVLGNVFQFSYRIDHNHSLFNFFLIFANFYIAFFVFKLFRRDALGKVVSFMFIVLLTFSGVIDIMAVKNDFQLRVNDAPVNSLMQWIRKNTQGNDIFLARPEILDPITLSGRKNYLGHDYYLSVMGYNIAKRSRRVKSFYEADNRNILSEMRKERITYIAIPKKPDADFRHNVDISFFKNYLPSVYEDSQTLVLRLE